MKCFAIFFIFCFHTLKYVNGKDMDILEILLDNRIYLVEIPSFSIVNCELTQSMVSTPHCCLASAHNFITHIRTNSWKAKSSVRNRNKTLICLFQSWNSLVIIFSCYFLHKSPRKICTSISQSQFSAEFSLVLAPNERHTNDRFIEIYCNKMLLPVDIYE